MVICILAFYLIFLQWLSEENQRQILISNSVIRKQKVNSMSSPISRNWVANRGSKIQKLRITTIPPMIAKQISVSLWSTRRKLSIHRKDLKSSTISRTANGTNGTIGSQIGMIKSGYPRSYAFIIIHHHRQCTNMQSMTESIREGKFNGSGQLHHLWDSAGFC